MEKLYNTLISVQDIENKNEPLIKHENRIITISAFHHEVQEYKNCMEALGVRDYSPILTVKQCQQALRDRFITLGLPLANSEQEITAQILEESITTKLVDEYHKTTNISKEEIIFVIHQVLKEHSKLDDTDIFHAFVNDKLEQVKQIKVKENENSKNQLLNDIRIELKKIAIANEKKPLFSLNIDTEINILQKIHKDQLKEVLKSLKQKNQNYNENDILTIEYNCLDNNAKRNVSLDDFKKSTNILVDHGYALNVAYDLIKNAAITSHNLKKFNDLIATISYITHNKNQTILNEYNLLSAEKKQFITQFQFKQALEHFYSLNFDTDKAIIKILGLINSSYNFTDFYGLVSINASADEEARGYGSKVQIENIYNQAKNKLEEAGILTLFDDSPSSLAEEQKNKTCKEFQNWIKELLLAPYQFLSSPVFTINSIAESNYLEVNNEFTSLNSIHNPLLSTINKNISLSNMYNFGGTCWLNSSLKFIYNFYEYKTIKLAINKKLIDIKQLSTPKLQEQLKNILISFSEIIDSMLKNEAVNIKIIDFLTSIHNYSQSLPEGHKDKEYMEAINKLIINTFDSNGRINMAKIEQQNVIEFIEPFVEFLNLNMVQNRINKKSFRFFTIAKKDLNSIGLDITTEKLEFEIETKQQVTGNIVKLPESSLSEDLDLKVEYLKDFCGRATNSANITSDEIQRLREDAKKINENKNIPSSYTTDEKLFANIKNLDKIPLNFNYGVRIGNTLFRDINGLKENINKVIPRIKIKIIDEETNQPYMVEAAPEHMVLFMGVQETGGHYYALSIDENGKVFIQNDSQNTTIEYEYGKRVADNTALSEFNKKSLHEKLVEYMELMQVYPVAIGFRVVSKTPII